MIIEELQFSIVESGDLPHFSTSCSSNDQIEFVAHVLTNSNIFKVPISFVGIPFFIVFGEIGRSMRAFVQFQKMTGLKFQDL
jgi:hypothetical protein